VRIFTVADLNVQGELQAKAEYTYATLEQIPGALELITHFATALWRSPQEFELPFPPPQRHLWARWSASAESAGITTIRFGDDELASVSLLACGLDRDADHITLDAFQRHLLRELRDTSYEPGFDLVNIKERPLVATVNFASPPQEVDRLTVALADRCFAAAYFRTKDLA
jgi:hypothetical protein